MSLKQSLFISYDGLTDPLGQSQVLPYYIGLSKIGHRITILSCEKEANFKKNREVVAQKCKANQINWEYTFYKADIPVVSPTLNTRRLRKKAKEVFQKNDFDIVHCRSIIPASIGYDLTKNSKAKLIFDIRGFWADERVDGRIWNLSNPVYRFLYQYFKKKERFLFKHADTIVTLTENAKNYIASHFETKGDFLVVPCCVDVNHFNANHIKEDEIQVLKEKLEIPKSNFVLTYVGSLGARYMLSEMLDFFKILQEIEPNSTFLFISKSDTSEIETIAKEKGIESNSILITSCEYQDIPQYISVGNASIFFIITSFSGKAVSPTKQAEVMSLGLPIVANSGLGDTDMILNKTKCGIVVNEFGSQYYAEAAKKLLTFNKSKEEVRAEALQLFTTEMGIERYDSIYQNL